MSKKRHPTRHLANCEERAKKNPGRFEIPTFASMILYRCPKCGSELTLYEEGDANPPVPVEGGFMFTVPEHSVVPGYKDPISATINMWRPSSGGVTYAHGRILKSCRYSGATVTVDRLP